MAKLINKWGWGVFLLLLLTAFSKPVFHPFHVSASEIEYNLKEKRLEISSKLFTDDFESVLTRIYKTKADFSDPSLKTKMDALVTRYITTHLSIQSNGTLLPLAFFGWEKDHEAVYVYTTAAAAGFNPQKITVENTILYDLFEDQINIVHFIINGNRKSSKLSYPDKKLNFGF